MKLTELERGILKIVADFNRPLSTREISLKLGKSWHTVDNACRSLLSLGRLRSCTVGKMKLWRTKE